MPTPPPPAAASLFEETRYQNASQKPPYEQNAVAPNVFLFANSQMPATSCTVPP